MNPPRRYGMILIVSGPSGSGKTTLCRKVFEEFEGIEFSVSCTTRPPRAGERDGVEYYFRTQEQFEELIRRDAFIEYASVHGNFYGTLKSEILDRIEKGTDVLLDIDVQGALSIKKLARENPLAARCMESVFVAPPDYAELERRLRGRATDAEEVIARRLANAKKEMSFWNEYKYVIVNDDLTAAQNMLSNIIHALRQSSARFKETPFHEY